MIDKTCLLNNGSLRDLKHIGMSHTPIHPLDNSCLLTIGMLWDLKPIDMIHT